MIRRSASGCCVVLVLVAGCLHPVCDKVDGVVCDLALQPRDLQPVAHVEPALPSPTPDEKPAKKAKPSDDELPPPSKLTIPDELLPGGPVPPIDLPPAIPEKEKEREKALQRLFPPLPPLGEDPPAPPGPEGRPLSLADLQRLAITNSPLIKQATARVEEARGAAIQAGLGPNPTVGWESDTTGTTGGAGYVGGFVEQTIKTANKLQLARAAAAVDIRNAELALLDEQAKLATRVRAGYFGVLVAQESIRLNRGLVKFTTDVYQIQVEQVRRGGFAAPYEPMYLRALATQARASLVQARNRRTAAWKELAATLGLPGMPPVHLAGRLDIPVPVFHHRDVLARMLTNHTDIRTAENALVQAHVQLDLARKTPIPDVNVRVMLQKDYTGRPFQLAPSVAVSVPVPVWDRNQGNILSAQAAVLRVGEEAHRARSDLTTSLADAFERYESSRVVLAYYRDQILPDLVRVYRGVHERYEREPGGKASTPPSFTDVVVAQQNLAQAVGSYIGTLGQLWQAVVDVAGHLQTFDLFGVETPTHPVAEIPDLNRLPALPCCHPCSPLPEMHQRVIDGEWPPAETTGPVEPKPAMLPAPRDVRDEAASGGVHPRRH